MPLFFLSAFSWLRSAFSAVLSFCSRPPGSYIAAAGILALGVWWWGRHEYNAGVAQCQAAHAKAAVVEVHRQETVIAKANAASDVRTEKSAAKSAANKARVVYIHAKADALPPAPDCAIPADISDGLRAIE